MQLSRGCSARLQPAVCFHYPAPLFTLSSASCEVGAAALLGKRLCPGCPLMIPASLKHVPVGGTSVHTMTSASGRPLGGSVDKVLSPLEPPFLLLKSSALS